MDLLGGNSQVLFVLACVANCDVCGDTSTCTTCKTGYTLNNNVCDGK